MNRSRTESTLVGLAGLALVLSGYGLARLVSQSATDILPSYGAIWAELTRTPEYYLGHLFDTFLSAAGGLAVGVIVAFVAGGISGISRNVYAFIAPLAVWVKATPIIALSPFLLLILRSASDQYVPMVSAAAVCFFPVFVNAAHGLREQAAAETEYVLSLQPSRLKLLWYVQLPFAAGYSIAGVKTASTLAVVGAMVGEFMGPNKGLGFVILQAQQYTNYSRLMLAVALSGLLGVTFYLTCGWVSTVVASRYLNTSSAGRTE